LSEVKADDPGSYLDALRGRLRRLESSDHKFGSPESNKLPDDERADSGRAPPGPLQTGSGRSSRGAA